MGKLGVAGGQSSQNPLSSYRYTEYPARGRTEVTRTRAVVVCGMLRRLAWLL